METLSWTRLEPHLSSRSPVLLSMGGSRKVEIGLEPVMTGATEAFFERSCSLGLAEAFPSKPDSMHEVVSYMEQILGRKPGEAGEGQAS